MLKKMFKSLINKKGQAMVELAIVLPIFLFILCGIIDFGWLYSNQIIITNGSREGARYAIVNNATNTDVLNRVISVSPSNIRNFITVTTTYSNQSDHRIGDVTVYVKCTVQALTPISGIFLKGSTMVLSSTCTMKME